MMIDALTGAEIDTTCLMVLYGVAVNVASLNFYWTDMIRQIYFEVQSYSSVVLHITTQVHFWLMFRFWKTVRFA